MTGTPPLELLDFKHPRKPKKTKWRALSRWHQSTCVLITESWNALLSKQILLEATIVEPMDCRAALQKLPDDSMGLHFVLGANRFPSLMVFTRRQLHGVLADILDMPGDEWPEQRRFTRAEESMLSVMFQGLADAISDAIPGPEATSCMYVEMFDKPQRTRLYAQIDDLFLAEIKVTSRFGEETAYWLLPRVETVELIGHELHEEDPEERKVHPNLVSLAQRIEVDVVVELGKCDISMSQVTRLAAGDILVLDQSIHRPVTAQVAGEPKWLGNPIRVGPRQGFEVVKVIPD